MPNFSDIPTPWYLRAAIWIARQLRKSRATRKIVRSIKGRLTLGPMTKVHLAAIHAIRRISVNQDSLPDSSLTYEALQSVADGCRDAIAEILEVWNEHIHCTLKLCGGDKADKRNWKVYTVARSDPCNRPAEFGRGNYHLVGDNSSFAPLAGCNDRKNVWEPNVFSCFSCGNLRKYTRYDSSGKNWESYYNSTIVFPLRYRKSDAAEFSVIGFLTFDSQLDDAFGDIPCIFECQNNPAEYQEKLSYMSLFHVGGILADVLAMTFHPLVDPCKEVKSL